VIHSELSFALSGDMVELGYEFINNIYIIYINYI